MRTIHLFWTMQPTDVRLVFLGVFAVVSISVVRFVRLAWRLYHYSGESIVPEKVVKGAVAPDLLARSALANRVRCKTMLEKRTDSGSFTEKASGERVLYMLRMAESTFAYLWERCYADVESTKRACVLTLLLSCIIVSCGAYPTFVEFSNEGRLRGDEALYLTVFEELVRLAVGLSLCAILYMVSSFFERTLSNRKACWKYFYARLKNESAGE